MRPAAEIRPALESDLTAVLTHLMERFYPEYDRQWRAAGFRPAPVDAKQVAATLWHGFQTGMIWVIEVGAIIIGSFCLCIDTKWFSSERQLGERWVYVEPPHRSYPLWLAIARTMETFAADCGLRMIVSTLASRVDVTLEVRRKEWSWCQLSGSCDLERNIGVCRIAFTVLRW